MPFTNSLNECVTQIRVLLNGKLSSCNRCVQSWLDTPTDCMDTVTRQHNYTTHHVLTAQQSIKVKLRQRWEGTLACACAKYGRRLTRLWCMHLLHKYTRRRYNISLLICRLHWRNAMERIDFWQLDLAFKCVHGLHLHTSPINVYSSSWFSSSASSAVLVVRWTRLTTVCNQRKKVSKYNITRRSLHL